METWKKVLAIAIGGVATGLIGYAIGKEAKEEETKKDDYQKDVIIDADYEVIGA